VRIAQITDLHLDDFLAEYYKVDTRKNLVAVLSHIKQDNIAGIVVTGDLGDIASSEWLFSHLVGTGLPFEFILGNHDKIEHYSGLDFLKTKIKPSGLFFTASFGWGDWIFLDSRTGEIDQDQLKWLTAVIKERKATENLIVFVHHPILDCGNSAMDREQPLRNRDQVRGILEEFKGEVSVFCGHYHNSDCRKSKNITQYLTWSCLMQLRLDSEEIQLENREIGYRVIELDEQGMKTWPVLVDGT
jgi:Icc protein